MPVIFFLVWCVCLVFLMPSRLVLFNTNYYSLNDFFARNVAKISENFGHGVLFSGAKTIFIENGGRKAKRSFF